MRGRAERRSQIVRRQLRYSDTSGGFLHDVPNRLYRHPISPCPSHLVDPAEQSSSINCGCGEPIVQFGSHPIGNWNRFGCDLPCNEINNGPMLLALLEMIQCQSHSFMPPQTHRRVAMRARLGHVFLSVAGDRVLAKAHCSALPLTSSPSGCPASSPL